MAIVSPWLISEPIKKSHGIKAKSLVTESWDTVYFKNLGEASQALP